MADNATRAAYQRHVRRQRAYGRWAGNEMVDAGPVRDYVNELRAAGLGVVRIGELTGVGEGTMFPLLYGDPADGVEPTKRMAAWRAEAILRFRPSLDLYAPGATIDATGTRRRLQALTAIGWSATVLSQRLGRQETAVRRTRTARVVLARNAVAVRDLYDELWDQRPNPVTPNERASVTKAKRLAVERGWPPPMAWDDDSIDDPDAVPDGLPEPQFTARKLPADDELLWLLDVIGEHPDQVAARFGVHPKTVAGASSEARKKVSTA